MSYDETRSGHQSAVSSHVDLRSRRQKLADLANHPRTPPAEAAAAQRALDALPVPKTLTRDEILAQPDLRASVGSRRVWSYALRGIVLVDEDDALYAAPDLDWDGVE